MYTLLCLFVSRSLIYFFFFFFQAEDGIRDLIVTGVQTCALPISLDFLGLRLQERAPHHQRDGSVGENPRLRAEATVRPRSEPRSRTAVERRLDRKSVVRERV